MSMLKELLMPSQLSARSGSTLSTRTLAVFFLLATSAAAENGNLPSYQKTQIETAVSNFMAAQSIPGTTVAIVENGEFVWSQGFGMADLENSIPATSQTLYRLASISKPLSAIGAMQLWQMGKLDLDVPLQKYCPSFPQKEFPIT